MWLRCSGPTETTQYRYILLLYYDSSTSIVARTGGCRALIYYTTVVARSTAVAWHLFAGQRFGSIYNKYTTTVWSGCSDYLLFCFVFSRRKALLPCIIRGWCGQRHAPEIAGSHSSHVPLSCTMIALLKYIVCCCPQSLRSLMHACTMPGVAVARSHDN